LKTSASKNGFLVNIKAFVKNAHMMPLYFCNLTNIQAIQMFNRDWNNIF